MGNVTVKLNLRGINAVMTSPGVKQDNAERASRIARAAGDNFERVIRPHRYTARAFIRSKGAAGAAEEARDKVLTRAIDAAR